MNPAAILLALLSYAAAFGAGAWWQHGAASDARAELVVAHRAELERIAAANEAAIASAEADRAALLELGEAARGRLAANLANLAAERDTLHRRLDHAANQYRPIPGAALVALPRAVITCGAWRVLNRAAASDPAAAGDPPAAAAYAATDAACTDDALDSGLSLGDLYRWQRDYAERCRAIEYQLGELIDFTVASSRGGEQ